MGDDPVLVRRLRYDQGVAERRGGRRADLDAVTQHGVPDHADVVVGSVPGQIDRVAPASAAERPDGADGGVVSGSTTVTTTSSLRLSAPSSAVRRRVWAPAALNIAEVETDDESSNVTAPGPSTNDQFVSAHRRVGRRR